MRLQFKRCAVHVAILTGLVAGVLSAAQAYGQPVANDQEVQVAAGFFHAQGSDTGNVNGSVSWGYYLNDPAWQVGARIGANYSFIDGARDQWAISTIPFLNYHFLDLGNGTVVPFLGAFVGATFNDIDATGTVGPQTGIKFFLNDQTFVGLSYRYEWFWSGLDVGSFNDDLGRFVDNRADGNHVASVAIGYVWGGDDRVDRVTQAVNVMENAAERAENSAKSAELAADKTEAAADRLERGFGRSLRK